ncbi:uncharacterized protein LOC123009571 [Tribolium madens]|uniref:uncharacterized protein LOC123009571 n=1 Tax=Tribolium madens TaxID=41895 RepID=UPI001CF75E39|nr:uncharacterized protein LOC123009571 [Tribolium madens]
MKNDKMPSHKPIKTYEKRTRSQHSESAKAFNALLAENLTKRLKCRKKKATLKLKELPPRMQEYLTDESLKVSPNNTFDKLVKGKVYNEVKVANFVKIQSSESEASTHVSVCIHSPVMITRQRKRPKVVITEAPEPPKRNSTLDKPVTSSLSIEKENQSKMDFSSLSYIKLPQIRENEVSNCNRRLFSDTFREKQTVHSSTPCVTASVRKIIADPISPITKSDSSKLWKKSIEEISKWDEEFPKLDTPKGAVLRNKRKSASFCQDWKLTCQPKVYLKASDILTRSKSKRNCNDSFDFKGFTEEEQSSSSQEWNITKSRIKDLDQDLVNWTQSQSKISETPPRRTTRSVTKKSLGKRPTRTVQSTAKTPKRLSRISARIAQRKSKVDSSPQLRRTSKRPSTPLKRLSKKSEPSTPRWMTLRSKRKVLSLKTSPKKTPQLTKVSKRKSKDLSKSNNSVSTRTRSKQFGETVNEKEVSCNSTSFDFSSPSKINDDLEEEKEVELPKKRSLTVNLKDFDDFTQHYFSRIQVPEVSAITLRDDSVLSDTKGIKIERKSDVPKSVLRNGSVTSRKSTPNPSKIIILSSVTLPPRGKSISPEMLKTCQDVWHDHSYSNSPKQVRSSRLSDIIESSIGNSNNPSPKVSVGVTFRKPKSIKLNAGKSYRRSLSLLRRSSVIVNERISEVCQPDCGCFKCLFRTKIEPSTPGRCSVIVPAARKSFGDSILENYARRRSLGYVQQEEKYINDLDDSVRSLSLDTRGSLSPNLQILTAKDVVLRRCGQTDILPFEQCYPRSALQHCQKIGEGVYGEVFLYRNPNGGTSVMKVIPIEGDLIVNGEKQKKFEEILSEIVIAMELSSLRNDKKNTTTSFSQVQNIKCVQGCYPERLLDLWELYDETRGSENDSPQMFPPHQQYIILELANGGEALESYVFNNAQQAYAMFKQTACALAVAESELKFEHRDLHWGNILINTVDKSKVLRFRLNGKEIEVETNGIEATIIDFTLSRIEFEGVVIFNDLSLDNDLFVAKGDYQFEIYRLMQKANGNMWQQFQPYTNILWLHYVLDKAVSSALRYKNPKSKVHHEYITKLKKIKDEILTFSSVAEFVKRSF